MRHFIGRLVRVGVILEAVMVAVNDFFFARPAPAPGKGNNAMGQLFGPRANAIFRVALVAGVLFIAGALVIVDLLPRASFVTGRNRFVRQDIPFSHEHHAGEIGIECGFCHQFAGTASFAGIPQSRTCMKCHRVLFKDAPMLAPVRESFRSGRPLSWNRVYRLPDFVYFNHGIHVAGGVSCATCHGDLRRMPWVRRADAFFMDRCLGCHQQADRYVKAGAQRVRELRECSACHR